MKNQTRLLLAFIIATARCVAAQNYSLDWRTIDGGGGTSSNATYVLSGTIGQPDAGNAMTGGGFSVQGGFWPGVEAVQTPGAPFLSIARVGADVIISWNPPLPGFVLQQTADFSTVNWQNAPSGNTNHAVLPASGASRFYRLLKR